MKIYYHYEHKCDLCNNFGTDFCKNCLHNDSFSYLAENKDFSHYFNNKEEFIVFLLQHFGEYKAIVPIDYFSKISKKNEFEGIK